MASSGATPRSSAATESGAVVVRRRFVPLAFLQEEILEAHPPSPFASVFGPPKNRYTCERAYVSNNEEAVVEEVGAEVHAAVAPVRLFVGFLALARRGTFLNVGVFAFFDE